MTYVIGTFAVAQMGGLDIPPEEVLVRTSGYSADEDGGSALFAAAASMPDTPARFQDSSFRWFGLAKGQEIAPEKFGAVNAGSDATAAIQAALDFAAEDAGVVDLRRIYLCSSEIEIPIGVAMRGPRSSGLKRIDEIRVTLTSGFSAGTGIKTFTVNNAAGLAVGQSVMFINGSAYAPSDPYSHRNPVITAVNTGTNQVTVDPRSSISAFATGAIMQTASHGLILLGDNHVQGFTIDGNETEQTSSVWRTHTELVVEGSGCIIEDIHIKNGASDLALVAGEATSLNPIVGVYVLNTRFTGCDFENGGCNGIHLSFADGVVVSGCRFRQLNRRNSGLNVEHQDGGVICSYNNRNVTVDACDFEEMIDAVGNIVEKITVDGEIFNHDFTVTGCRIHNCYQPLRVLDRGGRVVFANNRVSADYPYAGGLTDSRVYLLGTSLSERAGRIQILDNQFTNVRIASTNVRGVKIDNNGFDLSATTATGTIHPITLSNSAEGSVVGNTIIGGGYGIRMLNFGVAGDVTDLVVEANNLIDQRWTGIRGDDSSRRVEALVRGNAISNNAATAIGADYRAVMVTPGMFCEGNRIDLAIGSAWDISLAGTGVTRGRNLVNGGLEEIRSVADISGTAYTLQLADAGGYRRTTGAAPVTITVPPDASVAFPIGTELTIEQAGAGPVSLVGGSGVTLGTLDGFRTSSGQYARVRLVKVAANSWTAAGDLEFSPVSFYAAGEKGLLFDISDLGSMFQDSAGTTPAAVDSQVGLILDRSGSGFNATQSTSAARPTLRQVGGRHYLEFNGTSQYMLLAGMSVSASAYTLTAGLDPTQTTIAYLLDAQTGRLIFATREGTADDFVSYFEGATWRRGGATATGDQVLSWRLASAGSSIRRNSVSIGSGLAYTNRAIGGSVALGRHNSSAAGYLKGKLYGLFLINRALSDAELAQAEKWIGSRTGVSL